ncbi:chemosensory receptor c [Plakobranchus ocellatus]|uniref:Chemosensory receptor c n=1 Tax=Plakobranchus ocellatus TaxID=259542 RepID=A0AAV3ZQD9_9GAST|nr:chemosensory receptor c [Plakobranchus ocellatus]
MDARDTNLTQIIFPYNKEFLYTFWILASLAPGIVVFGLCANITNIVVFLKAGVKDNVTTLLLSLSASDLTFLILLSGRVCAFLIKYHDPEWEWPFARDFIETLPYWPAFTFYAFSSYISVWLGVTCCACVAMPLQFKSVFTKSRTVKAVLILFTLAVSFHIPVMSMIRLAWETDSNTNHSFAVVIRQNSESLIRFNDILN